MTLPLRLRAQVRDLWAADASDVQASIKSLAMVIGKPVVCEPEWPLLWNELQGAFPDQAVFVPTLASTVVAWIEALQQICEEEQNEEWLDEMLEGIGQSLDVVVMAGDRRPSTEWLPAQKAFQICFPRKASSAHTMANIMVAAFHADLLRAFTPAKPSSAADALSHAALAQLPDESSSSWTDIGSPAAAAVSAAHARTASSDFAPGALTPATTLPLSHGRPASSAAPAVTRFPQLNTIPRPEDVLSRPPYHVVVKRDSRSISVECSHQPSLELLGEYLRKWVKKNHHVSTKPPMVEIEMRAAIFGLSTIHDHLEVSVPNHKKWTTISPMLILAFVSNVLGFELTFQDGHSWHFMRREAYK